MGVPRMVGAELTRRRFLKLGELFEQRDPDTLLRAWADDAVFEFGGASGISGRFAGKDAIRGWFDRWFARMNALEMTIRHVGVTAPWALGRSNTVMVEWTAEETSHGVRVHSEGVTVYDVRRGKIVRARNYLFDERPAIDSWSEERTG